jgi:SsrA-binding protein
LGRNADSSIKHSPRILNRRARHEFAISEVVECGMELLGTEVKSIRAGGAKIDEAYARVRGGQVFLVGMNISHYSHAAGDLQHDPLRDRRLLLHRGQIRALDAHVRQKGKTLVPLAVYFKDGWAKCELGLAVGKRQYDKRQAIKARDQERDIEREMRRGRKPK